MDPILISIGAFIVSLYLVISRAFEKSLSIREHDEYRHGMDRTTDSIKAQFTREIERIDRHLSRIEDSRPTAGELQIITNAFKERIAKLEHEG